MSRKPPKIGPAASEEPTYQRPFALVKDEDGDWNYTHDLPEYIREANGCGNASLELHPTGTALSIKFSPQHALGLNYFFSNEMYVKAGGVGTITAEPSSDFAALDITKTLATVSMYTDGALKVSAMRDGVSTVVNVKSILVPDAEYWYVAAGTVLGIGGDGNLKRVPSALVLRSEGAEVKVNSEENLAVFRHGLKCFFEEGRSLGTISHPNVVLTACKSGYDQTTVLRVYEASGQAAHGVRLRINAKILAANEAGLIEDSLSRMSVVKDSVQFDLHPFEIKTIKLKIKTEKTINH